jgi:hypothetical protein
MSSKQTTGLNRDTMDKYYTKPYIVSECIAKIKEYITIDSNDLIIEPSAGNGAFITEIKTISNQYKFYDLYPENNQIIKQDYLKLNISHDKKIHIIGNPPFGRQSSLAKQFIKKSCMIGDSISFILPKSFKKDSMKKCFNMNFHLIYEKDIDDNGFLVNGVDNNVPCVFQIWEKKIEMRDAVVNVEPNGFIFTKKSSGPDISFRRIGVYAGKIDKTIIGKSDESHYYIKFTNNKSVMENIEKLKTIKFDFNNTVGPKSISKQELIKEFNKKL